MGPSETDTSNDTAPEPFLLTRHGSRVLLVGTGDDPAVETSLTELAAVLIEQAGVPNEHIRIMLDPPGTTELRSAVADIAAAASEALLIYYVGPGVLGADGELQLATSPVSQILGTAREHDIRLVVLVLDCSLTRDSYLPAVTVDLRLLPEPVSNEFLLASIAPNEPNLAVPGTTHTALTDALITLLRHGDPAEPPDLTPNDIYQHLSRTLPPTGRLRRTGDLTSELVLVRNPAYPVRQPRRRHRWHRRRLILLALVCVLALLGAGGIWLWPRLGGGPEPSDAGSSAKLAADAKALRTIDPGLAAQLAIAAYRAAPIEQAADQLYASLNTPLDAFVDNTGNNVLKVAAAAHAPLVAASNQDQMLRIWNIANLTAPVLNTTIKAGGVGIALAPQGNLLAAGCGTPRDLCLWSLTDPHQPTIVARLPRTPTDPGGRAAISSMAISPDSSLLAVAALDGFTALWSIADPSHPQFLAQLPNPTSDSRAIAAVAFSPRGNLLADTILRGTTKLWNITNPSAPTQVATMDTGYASVAFSPDGSLVAAVGNAEIGLWNIDEPAKPAPITVTPISASATPINRYPVTFSADGSQLAFAGFDTSAPSPEASGELCTLDLYPANLQSGTTFATCTATGFGMPTMAATANGALFTGGFDGTVRLWRSALPTVNGVHTTDNHSWATSPNGRLLAAPVAAPNYQSPSSVGVWNIGASGGPSLEATLPTPAQMISFLTSTTLLTATQAGPVQLWDLTDPRHPVQAAALGTATVPDSALGWPLPAAMSGNTAGDLVSVLDGAGVLHLWRVTSPSNAVEIGSIHPATAVAGPAGVLPDGRTAWLITSAGVNWWDISDPEHPVRRGTSQFSKASVVTTATNLLALGSTPRIEGGSGALDLFDLTSGRPPSSITVSSSVNGLAALSQDGRLLAAIGIGDNSMTLWDIRDPRQPRTLTTVLPLPGVQEISFNQAGNQLADWNNNTVEMWDIHDPTGPIREATLSLQPKSIYSARFTEPDGPIAVVTDGSIALFDIDPAKLADRLCSYTGPAITPAQWQKYAPGVPYQKPCR